MQAGLIRHYEKLKLRCESEGTFERSHDDGRFGISHGAYIDTKQAYNADIVELGIVLEVAAQKEGGFITEDASRYSLTLYAPGEVPFYQFTQTNAYQAHVKSHIIIEDFKVFVKPGLGGLIFAITWSKIDWYIEDAFFAEASGGGGIEGTLTQPVGVPWWGIPPTIGGLATVATDDPETEGSASVDSTARGGWSFWENGAWRELPAKFELTNAPAVPGCNSSGAMSPQISVDNCNDAELISHMSFAYSEADMGERECCFRCWDGSISNPCATIHTDKKDALVKSLNSFVTLIPDMTKSFKRMNGVANDYQALWLRGGLPSISRGATTECCRWEGEGCGLPDIPHEGCDDRATSNVTIASSESMLLSTVSKDPHAIESYLSVRTRCPYHFTSTYSRDVLFEHTIVSPGACPLCPPGEICENEDPSDVCCEGEWKSYSERVHKEGGGYGVQRYGIAFGENPDMIPALNHEADDARYVNYFASPHWNYILFFPHFESSLWPVYGTHRNDTDYWQDIRSQYLEHPLLPTGERKKTRNNIISEPLTAGVFADYLRANYGGAKTSWVGISRFKREPWAPPLFIALDESMQDGWSFTNCSESFETSGIVLTPAGTNIQANFDIGFFGPTPALYGHIGKAIALTWESANIASVEVYLVDQAGSEVLLTTEEGKWDRPDARSSKYAGSWAQEFGVGVLTDEGADSLPEGISEATLQNDERVHFFQLLSGWGAKTLSIRIEVVDDNEDVEIGYPEFHLAGTQPLNVHETGQTSALIYESGPGVRYGQWKFWNTESPQFEYPPLVRAIGKPMTVLDALCYRNLVMHGKDAEDGLDDEIEAMYDPIELGSDMELDPREQVAEATHAFIRSPAPLPFTPPGSPPTLRQPVIVYVNSWSECPPICGLPLGMRDAITLVKSTTTYALEAWTYIQEPMRYIAAHEPIHLVKPPDELWSGNTSTPHVPGWPIQQHTHVVDNNEGDGFIITDETSREIATASPWHGYFANYDLVTARGLDLDIGDDFAHVRAIEQDGKLILGFASNVLPLHYLGFPLGADVDDARISIDKASTGQAVYILREFDGSVTYEKVQDWRTIAMSIEIAEGKVGDIEVARHGLRYLYWIEGGTQVRGVIYDTSDTEVVAPFDVITIDEDTTIAVREFVTSGGRWTLEMLATQSSQVVALTSVDGENFA